MNTAKTFYTVRWIMPKKYNNPYDEKGRENRERYFQLVKILYDSGFDMEEKDRYGRSPLEYAKDCTDKRLAALIEGTYSEDIDQSELTGGLTLQDAVERKDYDVIRIIAAKGSNLGQYMVRDGTQFNSAGWYSTGNHYVWRDFVC